MQFPRRELDSIDRKSYPGHTEPPYPAIWRHIVPAKSAL